jgi:anthranilate phosphoribosyltransferase
MSASEQNWPDLLTRLMAGESLQAADTRWAMDVIMDGNATSAQIAAFAVSLRAKGETAQEVRGLVDAMLAHALPLSIDGPTLDIVGTGGDLSHSVNVSTMAAVVAAAAGARVVKHGNRAATSSCGSADVLEKLGVKIDLPPEGVAAVMDKVGITFCFAPVFHSAMRHAGPPRREIGVPTVFNIMGPLANPARPSAQLVGCADERLAPVMAEVLRSMGVKALVVRGADGLDEISTSAPTRVWDVRGDEVVQTTINPADLGIASAPVNALRGGDAAFNATVARAVFSGEWSSQIAPVRDAVALNAAAALVALEAVDQPVRDLHTALALALEKVQAVLNEGTAESVLRTWVDVSSQH